MKKITEITVTITIPKSVVEAVIKTQKRVNAGKESNEYAAVQEIAEWLQGQIDTEHEIWNGILDAYDVPNQ